MRFADPTLLLLLFLIPAFLLLRWRREHDLLGKFDVVARELVLG